MAKNKKGRMNYEYQRDEEEQYRVYSFETEELP